MSDRLVQMLLCYWATDWETTHTNLFAYPIFPDSLIFPSIRKVQDSFSMKHAILHLSFISGMCGECVLSSALHPKTGNHFFFKNKTKKFSK